MGQYCASKCVRQRHIRQKNKWRNLFQTFRTTSAYCCAQWKKVLNLFQLCRALTKVFNKHIAVRQAWRREPNCSVICRSSARITSRGNMLTAHGNADPGQMPIYIEGRGKMQRQVYIGRLSLVLNTLFVHWSAEHKLWYFWPPWLWCCTCLLLTLLFLAFFLSFAAC